MHRECIYYMLVLVSGMATASGNSAEDFNHAVERLLCRGIIGALETPMQASGFGDDLEPTARIRQ